jgi:hypothetical protein
MKVFDIDFAADDFVEGLQLLGEAVPSARVKVLEAEGESGWPFIRVEVDEADVVAFSKWYEMDLDELLELYPNC